MQRVREPRWFRVAWVAAIALGVFAAPYAGGYVAHVVWDAIVSGWGLA